MDINSAKDPTYTLYSKEERIRNNKRVDAVVGIIDDILYHAITIGASDIHMQPSNNGLQVRLRVDGILNTTNTITSEYSAYVISRLKVLAFIDISKKMIPQDGKLCIRLSNSSTVEIRVATFPTIYGEKVVLRILDNKSKYIKLENLGFSNDIVNVLNKLISKPQGLLLVTGPTGSGKTTSLYSILSRLNFVKYNVVTMEDPVEYRIDGITQSQVNALSGFTFNNGLRYLVRQDPDIIMIGEIRDKETAVIAIEAALTGHLVLSTLHTSDAPGAITRLIDMGIERFLINASLTGVLSQRLVRKLCEFCKYADIVPQEVRDLGLNNVFYSRGCKHCFNVGYKGRVAIGELLLANDTDSYQPMSKDLLNKLRDGIISLEEFYRVI